MIKICKQCKRELPMDSDHFFKKKDNSDGFTIKCKECFGKKFTNKLTKIPKEGYKFCIKCDRELKANISYFPPDKLCNDGFRNVCRECGKDGHFMKEDYYPKKWWSDEENERFIELYPHYTNKELLEIHYPHLTEKAVTDKAFLLGVVKSEETNKRRYAIHSEIMCGIDSPLYGIKRSDETKLKLSEARKGKYTGENSWWFGKKRSLDQRNYISKAFIKADKWKGENNPRHKDPLNGERNGNWQGGITPLNAQIRNSNEYLRWKISVFKRDDYTCLYCGSKKKLEAHHIYNFSTNEEKRFDLDNGLTMCVTCHNPINKGSFHNTYGTFKNNLTQLHEFFNGVSWDINTMKILNLENKDGDLCG